MRRIIAAAYVSLDGVMEAPERWAFAYQSEDVTKAIDAQIMAVDAAMFGRKTYEIFSTFWPKRTGDKIADKLNSQTKYVVSNTLDTVEWNNSQLVQGDVVEAVQRLKQEPGGDIGISGSATLVQSLTRECLIDEYQLLVFPVVLGSGKRLFDLADRQPLPLKLARAEPFQSGVMSLTYVVE